MKFEEIIPVCNFVVSRITVISNDLPILVNDQAVSGIIKYIIKKHTAQSGYIIGATKYSDDITILINGDAKDYPCLLIYTAFKRIT